MRTTHVTALPLAMLLARVEAIFGSSYQLDVEYSGQSFLDGFDFYTVSAARFIPNATHN